MVLVCQNFVAADYAQGANLAGVSNGGSLVALTNPSAALAVDGATLSVGDKVVLAAQADPVENGYYELTMQGNNIDQQWVLTRVDPGLCLTNCMAFFIKSGETLAESLWILEGGAEPVTPGASSLVLNRVSVVPASGPCVNIVQLTDSTGGVASDTLAATTDTSASDQSGPINNNFASNGAKINAVLQCLIDLGLMAAP
jgi:hypothetical protein